MKKIILVSILWLTFAAGLFAADTKSARDVLNRLLGDKQSQRFDLELVQDGQLDWYEVTVQNNKALVKGNTAVALCSGVYNYLRDQGFSIISWSGNRVQIPETLSDYHSRTQTPYRHKYYMNVVTHGYTTPYWNWERWEKELDWMAVHGFDMPLMPGAHEAILNRVWIKLGLDQKTIDSYFTGPAHFPWNRMGNLTGWDGPLPASYFDKQIALTHKQKNRMQELGMKPIIPAFAGFVPQDIVRFYPDAKVNLLQWDKFPDRYNGCILLPGQKLFETIGTLYIQEWEKEFGKGEFYLADSFNEMDVPVSGNLDQQCAQLSAYGDSVYKAIYNANPDAVWVMQGWTFPFHHQNGELFWTPKRLSALMAPVPDDKLLILDLANEYNLKWWNMQPSWEKYEGFFGKSWIYSYIPNMGGKSSWTGYLSVYGSSQIDALKYPERKNQVGYGMAPEGVENNEMIYELISNMIWKIEPMDLDKWVKDYCISRYGAYPEKMKQSYDLIRKSVYNSFTDHPRYSYQRRQNLRPSKGSAFRSADFIKAIQLFAECEPDMKNNPLYTADLIDLASQYLSLAADDSMFKAYSSIGRSKKINLDQASEILMNTDRLLQSHPNRQLEQWISYAKNWGDTDEEKNYYESNAKRIVSSWGAGVDDYSARVWSGLIRDYYIPRMQNSVTIPGFNKITWEEKWVKTPGLSSSKPFDDPAKTAADLILKYQPKSN